MNNRGKLWGVYLAGFGKVRWKTIKLMERFRIITNFITGEVLNSYKQTF
jgi:hypothetical protein